MALRDVRKFDEVQLQMVNRPADAASVFADGFAGVIADDSTFKLSLFEKLPGEDMMAGKFVLNLILSRSGIKAVQEQLNSILEQIEGDEALSQ